MEVLSIFLGVGAVMSAPLALLLSEWTRKEDGK